MQPVQHVARGREREAMDRLGQSRRHLDAQLAKLEQLRSYRDQYAADFAASGEAGLDATRLRDYRVFLNRLGEAVRQQEVLVERYQSQHEQTRQQWVASRSHSQAIDKVVTRYREQELRQQEQREQREQDERSLRPRK